MGEHCQVRSCSWSKTPKRCSVEVIPEEFILIDDDNDVIILDFPESKKLKSSGASKNQSNSPFQGVISIDDDDDDDDDDDTDNVHQPGNSVEGVGDESGSGDSSRSFPAANLQRSPEVDDECQVIQENCSTFRFSKCKQTFSKTKASSRNRYGLGSESESDFSGSDCSDCEILDGSYVEVREQWEKASLGRKYKAGRVNLSSGLHKEASPSDPHCHTNPSVGVENGTEQHAQTSSFFTSRNSDTVKENSSFSYATGDENFHASFFGTAMEEDNHANASFCNEEESRGPSSSSNMEENVREFNAEFCSSDRDQAHSNIKQDHNLNHQKGDVQSECFSFSKRKQPAQMQAQHEEPASLSPENNCLHESVCQTGFKESEGRPTGIQVEHEGSTSAQNNCSKESLCQTSFNEVGKQLDEMRAQHEMSASPLSKKSWTKDSVSQSGTKEVKEQVATVSSPSAAQTSDRGGEDTLSVLGNGHNEVRCEHRKSSLSEIEEPIVSPTPSTSGYVLGVDGTAIERDIIIDREKLKETDEYKKAAEEEWESRQLQLQIQAEEAQRLRKRRKLESMRRLDMERRQKERVEEMRETQKKDEENMNMREQARAEVCKALKRLETACNDMASLLRGLGIPVGGGAFPPPHEVQAAYRRAVLKFHPDRASRGDIQQQVEAEEKFKLIARMKEKFLLALCR